MPVRNVICHLRCAFIPYAKVLSVTRVHWLWHNIKRNKCSKMKPIRRRWFVAPWVAAEHRTTWELGDEKMNFELYAYKTSTAICPWLSIHWNASLSSVSTVQLSIYMIAKAIWDTRKCASSDNHPRYRKNGPGRGTVEDGTIWRRRCPWWQNASAGSLQTGNHHYPGSS